MDMLPPCLPLPFPRMPSRARRTALARCPLPQRLRLLLLPVSLARAPSLAKARSERSRRQWRQRSPRSRRMLDGPARPRLLRPHSPLSAVQAQEHGPRPHRALEPLKFRHHSPAFRPARARPSHQVLSAARPLIIFAGLIHTRQFPPANLFSNVAASTSTPAPPSWSSSASPWATNPLFSGFKSSAEPSVGVDATQPEQPQWSQGEGEASFAEAKAAVAAAAAEAAEEAARDKFEAEAAAKAEQERLRRRQQQEESERREHTLKEQLRVRVVEDRQRAEVERARRAAEAEAEADRLAQEELAAVAEMARRQAVADAFSAKMAEEMMRRAEQPLIAERWHRARVLQKMWARWKERALEVALLLEQEEALKQRREQFKASVKDLMAGSGTASPRRNGTPRARTHSATPVTDAERARTLEDVRGAWLRNISSPDFRAGVEKACQALGIRLLHWRVAQPHRQRPALGGLALSSFFRWRIVRLAQDQVRH